MAKRRRAKRRKPIPREAPASIPSVAIETIAVAGLLLLLVAGVYWPVIQHEFVGLDDAGYFLRNPNLDGRFGLDDLVGAFARPYMANWTPLTSISIAIDNALYGARPSGFLVTNAVLHAAASIHAPAQHALGGEAGGGRGTGGRFGRADHPAHGRPR